MIVVNRAITTSMTDSDEIRDQQPNLAPGVDVTL